MTARQLFLLLSLPDHDYWLAWDEDWDYLMDYDFIGMESEPFLTAKGKKAIEIAVGALT